VCASVCESVRVCVRQRDRVCVRGRESYDQIGDVEDETSLRVELLGNGVCVCV